MFTIGIKLITRDIKGKIVGYKAWERIGEKVKALETSRAPTFLMQPEYETMSRAPSLTVLTPHFNLCSFHLNKSPREKAPMRQSSMLGRRGSSTIARDRVYTLV